MKKIITLFLNFICVLGLVACSKEGKYVIENLAPAGSTEEQEKYDDEEYLYATYGRFLAGDRNFLEEGKIFCWNSDAVEMSCRDYPLSNGMMVRQYDFAGTRTDNLFRYTSEGEMETITTLFVREELMQEDSLEKCPYYSIDGNEIDEMEFEKQFELLIASNLLERTEWIEL